MRLKLFLFLPIFIFVFSSTALSQEVLTTEMPSMVRSVEALGMGGAYYGKSDSKYAAFYNPAGLTRVKESTVDFFPITVGVNQNGFTNLPIIIKSFQAEANSGVDALVNALMKKRTSVGPIAFFPAYTSNRFTFGLFTSTEVSMVAYDSIIPMVALNIKSDNGLTFGMAESFLDDKSLSIGISFKALLRSNVSQRYSALELTKLIATPGDIVTAMLDQAIGDGLGFGFLASVGAMYNIPILEPIRPRIALSINDVGFTILGASTSAIFPTVNLSLAFSPRYYSIIDTDIVFDFVDIFFQSTNDMSFLKRFNMGAEVRFYDMFIVRVGLHQGYPTAGAGLAFKYFKINYAYYSEELGAYVGQLRDSRHVLEFVFRI